MESKLSGRIIKDVSGFYTVLTDNGEAYVCRARGRFRIDQIKPVVGDNVDFIQSGDREGYIETVLPRKNLLIRPAAANIDKLIIVIAASTPKPDLMLVDKLILQCELTNIIPVLVINKCDKPDDKIYVSVMKQYGSSGYSLISVSALTNQGFSPLIDEISGAICCFAGQSAVGKSSILNALMPELSLEVGDLSRKIERGRHTTRHASLWPAYGGAVLDTPGFSLLELSAIEPEVLSSFYSEMRDCLGECYFAGCLHVAESGCAVKEKLKNGDIAKERYERYVLILEELKEMRRRRYD